MQSEMDYRASEWVHISGQVYVDGVIYEFRLEYDWDGNLVHRYIAAYATVGSTDIFATVS